MIPQPPPSVIDYARKPHVGIRREDEPGPGRDDLRLPSNTGSRPGDLPHVVQIAARDAQKLVTGVARTAGPDTIKLTA